MKSKQIFFLIALFYSYGMMAQVSKLEGVSITLPANPSKEQVVRLATQVRPSYRQLDYQQREMLGFIHIGMNTFTGAEWGTGKEDPSLFNPSQLDADAWIKTFKDAGITGVILVAKHHDGFCIWPSRYTKHNISKSPWRRGQGDLVKEVSIACQKYGLKLCLYLSPWDMHEETYGTPRYNDYYIHQMEELLMNYGPVYLLWFDGAGTSSEVSGHQMAFDWERIFNRARELQPDIILSGNAPDVRWVGNEKGKGRETEWCVQGINNPERLFGSLVDYKANATDLGSVDDLMTKKRLVWYPSRGGLPLRKGWFYNAHDNHTVKSLSYLVDSYFATVGQNSNLLPNLSPDKSGRIPKEDAERLIQFGRIIKKMKQIDYAKGASVIPISGWVGETLSSVLTDDTPFTGWYTGEGTTSAIAEVHLNKVSTVNVIKLQENIRDFGQRVEKFAIDVYSSGEWKEIAQSTTIGFRKMIHLAKPVSADRFRIRFQDARLSVSFGNISMYYLEDTPKDKVEKIAPIFSKGIKKMIVDGIQSKQNLSTLFKRGLMSRSWKGQVNKLPATFIFELDMMRSVAGLSYIPMEDGVSGYIENYAIYLSDDGINWGDPVATGRFGNIENNPVEQLVFFKASKIRYVQFEVRKITSDKKTISLSGLNLIQ